MIGGNQTKMTRNATDWAEVKGIFEQTDWSVSKIAKKYDVSDVAIHKHARLGNWTINAQRRKLQARRAGKRTLEEAIEDAEAEIKAASAPSDVFPTLTTNDQIVERIRVLFTTTGTPIPQIAVEVSAESGTEVGEFDVYGVIDKHDWHRFGSVPPPAATGSSRYDAASVGMRDGGSGAPAPIAAAPPAPMVPPPPRVDLRTIRAPKRDVVLPGAPIPVAKARKVKASQLADIGRDGLAVFLADLRDIMANRASILDIVEEWNADRDDDADDPDPAKERIYQKLLSLTDTAALANLWKTAGQAYRSFTDGGAEGVGKKERQVAAATEIAEGDDPYAMRKIPAKLVARDGVPV